LADVPSNPANSTKLMITAADYFRDVGLHRQLIGYNFREICTSNLFKVVRQHIDGEVEIVAAINKF